MADFDENINVEERHDEERRNFYRDEQPQYPDDVEVTYMGPQNESEGRIGVAEVGIGGLAIGGGIAGVYLLVKGCRKLYNWITKKNEDDEEEEEERPRKKPVKKKAASKKKTTKKRPPKKVEEDDYEDGEYEDLDVDSDEETDED